MQQSSTIQQQSADRMVRIFLLIWTVLNIVQAYTLEVHPDEAYYWLYSRFLDWGYYDHPPMVAIFIRLGDSLLHNELGLRLFSVITSTATLWLFWQTLKPYAISAKWFILLSSDMLILHIYGFTTTPDSPLFFFTALFYYVYQRYIQQDKLTYALLLAIVVAGLLYSKYHGILLVGFTVCSNIKLLRRPSFWGIVIVSVALFMPHVLWQAAHNYPSLSYHLYERSSSGYNFMRTLVYLPGQFLMGGPLIGWFLFGYAVTIKVKDAFIRGLLVNFIGTITFFMLSTVKDDVQSHWTLIAFAPLLMLVLIRQSQQQKELRWLAVLAIINTVIIILLRIGILTGVPFIVKSSRFQSYYGYREWAKQVKQKVGDNYTVFISGFQEASKYDYYTRSLKGFSYDAREYRRTQFDIWPIEDSMQNKRAFYLMDFKGDGLHNFDSIKTARGTWYGVWVDSVRTFQKVDIQSDKNKVTTRPGGEVTFNLTVNNPYNHTISFKNAAYPHEVIMAAVFLNNEGVNVYGYHAPANFGNISLQPGQSAHYRFTVKAPMQKGRYELIFSIRTSPFPGGRNSRPIIFIVD